MNALDYCTKSIDLSSGESVQFRGTNIQMDILSVDCSKDEHRQVGLLQTIDGTVSAILQDKADSLDNNSTIEVAIVVPKEQICQHKAGNILHVKREKHLDFRDSAI